jgi:hypothetical protein
VIAYDENSGLKWLPRTPAMAADLTDHIWTLKEVFSMVVIEKTTLNRVTTRFCNHRKTRRANILGLTQLKILLQQVDLWPYKLTVEQNQRVVKPTA